MDTENLSKIIQWLLFTDCISSNNDCPSIKGRAKYIHMNDKRSLTRKGIEDQHCII